MIESKKKDIYFSDSRLHFSGAGEILVRLVTYSWYVFLSAAAFILLFSDIKPLFWMSVLLLLFLCDRFIHIGSGEMSVFEAAKRKKVNTSACFTPSSHRILNHSFRKSLVTKEDFHFILIQDLMRRRDVREAVIRLGADVGEFIEKAREYGEGDEASHFSRDHALEDISEISIRAFENSLVTGERFIEPRNLFVGVVGGEHKKMKKLLNLFSISAEDVREAVIFGRFAKKLSRFRNIPRVLGGFVHKQKIRRRRTMNRAWTARPTPTLDRYGIDLTELAKSEKVGFLIGHEKEVERLLNVLSRPDKPNALLVGDPGVGKTSIIAHIAFRMTKDDVPEVLFDKRLISLEVQSIIGDASPEEIGRRIKLITEEIVMAGNVVLCIPTIHDLFRTGREYELHAVDLLLPVVRDARIPVIGEAYPKEYKKYIEPRTDFLEQFEVVTIEEISKEEAIRFLVYRSVLFEREFNVFVTFSAIKKSVFLAHKYFHQRPLPGSAADLLKQALARASQRRDKILSAEHVIEIAEEQSKIPIQKTSQIEAEKLLNLEDAIHTRLVNQDDAVSAVSRALREYRSGLSRKGGPIAAFLFTGPTGVGKTELAKILTDIQFGSKNFMHRFDMTEYQDKQSIFRFIGNPDGSRTGALTDAVLQNPYSLILLDEFEKAHPDILNLFLQVFDDGRLTDSLGRTVNFENTIIISTSNAHSNFIKSEIEKGTPMKELSELIKRKLTEYFRPELVNRFSDIIVFRSLSQDEIEKIVVLLVKEVVETLKETHGIVLTIHESAIRKIAELGYSPVFGARPLRKVISEKIRSALAEKILKKEIGTGNAISVSYGTGEGFVFSVEE